MPVGIHSTIGQFGKLCHFSHRNDIFVYLVVIDYPLNANKETYNIVIARIFSWIIVNKLITEGCWWLQYFGPTYISLALGMHDDHVPACACISWE